MRTSGGAFLHWIYVALLLLNNRNSTFFTNAMVISPKVLCYGDSLTAGISPPLTEEFPYAKNLQDTLRTIPGLESSIVRWRGYPGWTSSALLNEGQLSALLDNIHASVGTLDLIIILAGTNDLAYESNCQNILQSIVGMHNIAHEKGSKTIAVGIPPSGWQSQFDSARLLAENVNFELASWAKDNESVLFSPFPIREFDRNSGFWSPDGLHFSPDGYQEIGESLTPTVATFLKKKNE